MTALAIGPGCSGSIAWPMLGKATSRAFGRFITKLKAFCRGAILSFTTSLRAAEISERGTRSPSGATFKPIIQHLMRRDSSCSDDVQLDESRHGFTMKTSAGAEAQTALVLFRH